MRVCLVTNQYASPYSGVGTYARELARGLVKSGIQTSVLCPLEQQDDSQGISFIPVYSGSKGTSHARWLSAARVFSRQLGKNPDFDIVHFLDAREALRYRGRGPCVIGTVHDYYFARPLAFWEQRSHYPDWRRRLAYAVLVRILEPRAYSRAHVLIMNSEATRARINEAYRLPPTKSKTVYIGIRISLPGEAVSSQKKTNTVLFVGGNPYRKGLSRLMRAISFLRETNPNLELWVVGTEIPASLRSLAQRLGLKGGLVLYRSVPRATLIRLYEEATIFALPGVTEAFGLVFLEAMACGCPVIAPEDGGAREIIEDGTSGFLIPLDRDDLLTLRLSQLLNDPVLRQTIAEEGRRRLDHFSPERMVTETIRLYQAAMNHHGYVL